MGSAMLPAGCGSAVGQGGGGSQDQTVVSTPPDSNPDIYGPPPPDFMQPPPGFTKTTADAVASDLDFHLVVPDAFGEPTLYLNPGTQMVALVYDSPAYGHVWLKGWPAESDASMIKAWVAKCAPGNGCQGIWSQVSLADSTPALLVTKGADTSLTWFDGSLRFDLQAPTSLARNDPVSIANAVQTTVQKTASQ